MQVRNTRRSALSLLALLALASLVPTGCGEPKPADTTPAQLETATKEREVIIQKEYGGGAAPKK